MSPVQETAAEINKKTNVIDKLRARAHSDKVFNAMCQKFISRERSRGQLTISSLKQSMSKSGHFFTVNQYAEALKFLDTLKLGTLSSTSAGRVVGLKDIKWTLQRIGEAGLSTENDTKNISAYKIKPKRLKKLGLALPTSDGANPGAVLTVNIGGRTFNFPIYRVLSEKEIAILLADLYSGIYENQKGSV